jgi:hypothetical protein
LLRRGWAVAAETVQRLTATLGCEDTKPTVACPLQIEGSATTSIRNRK